MVLGSIVTGASAQNYCLPTCSTTDARFLSLAGSDQQSIAGDLIVLALGAESSTDSLILEIYDGETSGVWDKGNSPLVFTLLADSAGDGTGTVFVDRWFGTSMSDASWHRIARAHSSSAQTEAGAYYYVLRVYIQSGDTTDANYIEDDGEDLVAAATWSNFKVRSNAHINSSQFGFCAPLFSLAEANLVYPNYPSLVGTVYDGTWTLPIQLKSAAADLVVWDGDFDFGSWDGVSMDSNDANTTNGTIPPSQGTHMYGEGTASGGEFTRSAPGVVTNIMGTASPFDDNLSQAYRRTPSIYYDVVDPIGVSYRNSNPSGNREWERFVVSTNASSEISPDKTATYLPSGLYQVKIAGMDMHNLNAWRYATGVIGPTDSGDVEPLPPTSCDAIDERGSLEGPLSTSSGEIGKDGLLYTWGDNSHGQLGDSTNNDRSVPVRVVKGDYEGAAYLGDSCGGVVDFSISDNRAVALLNDGVVMAWGHDTGGELGVGTTTGSVYYPKYVLKGDYPGTSFLGDAAFNPIEQLAMGDLHAIVVSAAGIVYAWGNNTFNQLGDGTNTARSAPTRVLKGAYNGTTYLGDNPANPIIDITAGENMTYALAADGTMYSWGRNSDRQLGDGTNTNRSTPVRVLKGAYTGTTYLGDNPTNPIRGIVALQRSCVALAYDGTLYSFGWNNNGQLGDNSTTDRSTAVRVLKGAYGGTTYLGDSSANRVSSIAGGGLHALALTAGGHVYAWGDNVDGQLGDSSTTDRSTPVRVRKGVYTGTTYLGDGTLAIARIAAGKNHSLAVAADDTTTYAWGDGTDGRIGDGGSTDRRTPVLVSRGARTTGMFGEQYPIPTIKAPDVPSDDLFTIDDLKVPADGSSVSLTINLKADTEVSLSLYGSDGKILSNPISNLRLASGTQRIAVSVPSDFSSGLYFLQVEAEGVGQALQFLLTR